MWPADAEDGPDLDAPAEFGPWDDDTSRGGAKAGGCCFLDLKRNDMAVAGEDYGEEEEGKNGLRSTVRGRGENGTLAQRCFFWFLFWCFPVR